MLYFKYKKDYYFIYILEKQKDIRVYELSNDRDLKFYFAPDPFEMSNSQTSNEDTNESESQNQTEEANQVLMILKIWTIVLIINLFFELLTTSTMNTFIFKIDDLSLSV